MKDCGIKLERIYKLLEKQGYDALVLAKRENFAWLTGGQESGVILNQENGFVYLVITCKHKTAVAMRADIQKAEEELLAGMGFTFTALDWKSQSKEAYIEMLLDGKRFLADIPLKGGKMDEDAIRELEYPMTENEVICYRELGYITDKILRQTAEKLKSPMTENELKAEFLKLCAQYDVEADVLLLGSDERIERYRHCTPTDKKIYKTVLISPALRKYGLHSNIARMLCIGTVPEEVRKRYDTVCQIQAEIISASTEGVYFKDIFALQERLYEQYGYADEWLIHGHGAPVGYMLSDGSVLYSQTRTMQKNQAYEWYVTITGVKSAELVMNIDNQQEILSVTGEWPVKTYITSNGKEIQLPDILEV